VSATGRTWELWAHRFESGELWHIGALPWVKIHGLPHPIVPVLVEEVLGDPYAPGVTHYGWQDAEGHGYRHGAAPMMIQVRSGTDPSRAMMLLDMCFAYGLQAEVKRGRGSVVALRVTERQEA
jgi:hypothetical protein